MINGIDTRIAIKGLLKCNRNVGNIIILNMRDHHIFHPLSYTKLPFLLNKHSVNQKIITHTKIYPIPFKPAGKKRRKMTITSGMTKSENVISVNV
jgi:hypothetical protein